VCRTITVAAASPNPDCSGGAVFERIAVDEKVTGGGPLGEIHVKADTAAVDPVVDEAKSAAADVSDRRARGQSASRKS
jgi:hypothetical protein